MISKEDDKEIEEMELKPESKKDSVQGRVIKPCLLITLKIEDVEAIEAYKDVDRSFILEDIQHGTLGDLCGIVSVEHKEAL